MTFGIDFDGTYNGDPVLFHCLVRLMNEFGHEAVMVTQRGPEFEPVLREVVGPDLPIYFAAGHTKRDFMREQGVHIDVWVDDNPDSIVNDALTYVGKRKYECPV